jgi:transposase
MVITLTLNQGKAMNSINIKIENSTIKVLVKMLRNAEKIGNLRLVNRIKAILALGKGHAKKTIAEILKVSEESIRIWVNNFILKGVEGLKSIKPSGRPSKLTDKQKTELKRFISRGPQYAGFPGACWRSPMIQEMIHQRFGVLYSVFYVSQLIKNMGYSYQKAKFTADHKDPAKRKEWLEKTWPDIYQLAKKKNAHILFGDEASFPQWGSLSYTWAKRGKQPVVKTSGIRKGYKVLGLIEYFTGKFYFKGHEGRLNSEVYAKFLKFVLSKTRKHIILIQDGAPYHTSKYLKKFFADHSKRITVKTLPSYSPDYNPIEMLWKKIKEKEIHLHYFPTFQSLKTKVEESLLHFNDMQNEILALFVRYQKLSESAIY